MYPRKFLRSNYGFFALVIGLLLGLCCAAHGQEWTWTTETVDASGAFSALAIDTSGNVHVGYLSPEGGGTKYGFRAAATGRWFTMIVDKGNGVVNLALDHQERPHLCYVPFATLKYARWDGSGWQIQEIAPGSGSREFSCSIAIDLDNAPHVTWYQLTDMANGYFVHIRHAVLKNEKWLARTLDTSWETGKWNNVRIDSRGAVYVSYSAFKDRALRCAVNSAEDKWSVTTIEDGKAGRRNQETTPGMGNSMALDKNGRPNFSYRDESSLRYAWPDGDHWRIDVVDPNANPFGNLSWVNQRTSLALDSDGRPHIAYETDGVLKHAWWDGTKWRIQPMGISGPQHRYPSLAISRDNVMYLAYSAPEDGSLRVLVGRPAQPKATGTQVQSSKK